MGSGIGRALSAGFTGYLKGQNQREERDYQRGRDAQERERQIQRQALLDSLTRLQIADAERDAALAPELQQYDATRRGAELERIRAQTEADRALAAARLRPPRVGQRTPTQRTREEREEQEGVGILASSPPGPRRDETISAFGEAYQAIRAQFPDLSAGQVATRAREALRKTRPDLFRALPKSAGSRGRGRLTADDYAQGALTGQMPGSDEPAPQPQPVQPRRAPRSAGPADDDAVTPETAAQARALVAGLSYNEAVGELREVGYSEEEIAAILGES